MKKTENTSPPAAPSSQIDIEDIVYLREALADRDASISYLRNRVLVLSQLVENAKRGG